MQAEGNVIYMWNNYTLNSSLIYMKIKSDPGASLIEE